MNIIKLAENFNVKTTKIEDEYNPEKYEAVNLDFFIDDTQFGEASISGVNTDNAFLYDVGIYPWFRGQGYANQMMEYILKNYPVRNLIVSIDNISAINLYKKYGFKIDRTFDDNGKEMYTMLKENLDEGNKVFLPNGAKSNTCYAIAYSILTGEPYEKALKLIPNGKYEVIASAMAKLGLSPQFDVLKHKNPTLGTFLADHPRGKYFVGIEQNGIGHAVAVIDDMVYNIENFTASAKLQDYYDFSKISKASNTTAYSDEDNKVADFMDNKFIKQANILCMEKFKNSVMKDGKVNFVTYRLGSEGFRIDMGDKKIDFIFPFNCTDQEVYKIIKDTIERN